jgi:predicted O-methyltransferase YrrM
MTNFDQPVLLETGCIRNVNEGTDSTLIIASTVQERGTFFTFELRPEHIEQCKHACGEYNRYINYVEGDSVANLRKYVAEGRLDTVHFAFLDSRNDGEHIWQEYQAIESRFVIGSVLVVDDVLWADKGKILRPHLEASNQWATKVFNVENGMLVATRR